jgi:hypothetical protein
MGLLMASSLLIENAACRKHSISGVILPLLCYGGFAGIFGSIVRSSLLAVL